jgi:hypothetical protein
VTRIAAVVCGCLGLGALIAIGLAARLVIAPGRVHSNTLDVLAWLGTAAILLAVARALRADEP